ncbi:ABC transporter permease [Actinacidiphila bryophytorum]|jgi:peptide/nickel transport system permease protein|uniref:Peptide/nickel transport system permease protein n=1 Tax=Actinacidiphila bryophytorum TaxID=1436133 RepID=A0A9W4E3C0_9ACTN|nr:ABC transporter permease [Actinacidiphila bryophytorum]MBM9440026.1 ABC transporter permease [Actinacidiphila bryophytorum]MBN6544204.1 ABC transporter permease [Actinacidiphila bryophytorum]CAG7603669.1 Peptide/nickel transport system permease protein [Actinacidiphila bryophytorum]
MTSSTETTVSGPPGEPDEITTAAPEAAAELVGRSPGQLMWLRFKRDRTGVISAYVVGFFFVVAILAPLIAKLYGKNPYTLYGTNEPGLLDDFGYPIAPNGGMSGRFWFGIEPNLGRDVFTQLIYGIRTSLGIALAVTIAVTITAILLGISAGYLGGKVDYFIGRITDLLMAFPAQLFFVAVMPVVTAVFVSPVDETPTYLRVVALITVQWFLGWMGLARLLRGQVLSLREREFIEAARVTGASSWRIVRRELLPNLVTPILVQSTLMLPTFVTAEAGLSFLGVGLVEPTPDWGRMFARGAEVYQNDITYMFFPGIAMVIFIVAFNLLGDSVRDAFDPKAAR